MADQLNIGWEKVIMMTSIKREISSHLNSKAQVLYNSRKYISVDEGVTGFKGRLSFHQYASKAYKAWHRKYGRPQIHAMAFQPKSMPW